ncbi:MAG: beta-propeller domain-containing protein, partial [Myxococcota bacterium]|nr:beta-propeller domain-containing protein [Myxococcota bacterium]
FVHQFDITDGPLNPSYSASGEVPGWVLNQFSLDESDGRLRIATTITIWGGGEDVSGIYVLEPSDGELAVVGQVEGLGVGEQIYSVRFVEDAAYVVTFRQIDPLYTVDLSDPTNPRARGELKIPGFSNYLHMVDDSHVLGIGQDIDVNGWESYGVQISLFDVSDLDNPTRSAKLTLEDTSWSEAQNQHHAFNYFAAAEALVVPATSMSSGESRMHVVHVNPDEPLEELGSISQDLLLDSSMAEDWYYPYCTGFRRSVIMGEPELDTPYYVYAQSNVGIVVADIEEPDTLLASVAFSGVDPCADGGYSRW